jgi:hypothetical protein
VWSWRKCRPSGYSLSVVRVRAPTLTCGVGGSVALRAIRYQWCAYVPPHSRVELEEVSPFGLFVISGARTCPHTRVWSWRKCRPAGYSLSVMRVRAPTLTCGVGGSVALGAIRYQWCTCVPPHSRVELEEVSPFGLFAISDARACPHTRVWSWRKCRPSGYSLSVMRVRAPTLACGVGGSVALRAIRYQWCACVPPHSRVDLEEVSPFGLFVISDARACPHTHVWSWRKCRPSGYSLSVVRVRAPTLTCGVGGSVALRAIRYQRCACVPPHSRVELEEVSPFGLLVISGARACPHTHVWSWRKCRPSGYSLSVMRVRAPTLACGVGGSVALRANDPGGCGT